MEKTFGGISIDGVCPSTDYGGSFITVGGTESYGNGGSDIWLIKTDSFGIHSGQNIWEAKMILVFLVQTNHRQRICHSWIYLFIGVNHQKLG